MLTALVTGASRGIGRAIAQALAHQGVSVGIHYNANLLAAHETLASLPGDCHALLQADLSDVGAAELLAPAAADALGGRVDILVHNAGIYLPSPVPRAANGDEWNKALRLQMQVNFFAGAELSLLLAPAMRAAGWGRIIHISSRAGQRGEAGHAGYAASKAAQIALVRSLAAELAPDGVGCFAIAPGWTETDMAADALAQRRDAIVAAIPAGRVATPEDVAGLVAFLCTPAADFLTGTTFPVNGASYIS